MIAMAEELGLRRRSCASRPVGVGFFADGEMHAFNGIGDFAALLAAVAARARAPGVVRRPVPAARAATPALEHVPLERWLRRHCGDRSCERIWRPLLDSRFDSDHDELPATYLWARTRRMRSRAHGAGRRRDDGLPGAAATSA